MPVVLKQVSPYSTSYSTWTVFFVLAIGSLPAPEVGSIALSLVQHTVESTGPQTTKQVLQA